MAKLIAPHEGRELELVLAGQKRMATIKLGSTQTLALLHAQEAKRVYSVGVGNDTVAFCLPHNRKYIYEYINLITGVTKTDSTEAYQRRMGFIFGYTEEEIQAFISGDIQCDCVECKGVQIHVKPN